MQIHTREIAEQWAENGALHSNRKHEKLCFFGVFSGKGDKVSREREQVLASLVSVFKGVKTKKVAENESGEGEKRAETCSNQNSVYPEMIGVRRVCLCRRS